MWTISWFCDQFGEGIINEAQSQGITIEELFNREAAKIPAGCEGLLTVHDWAPPATAVYRKGVMFGFDGRHTRAHIYRSILEGIAFTVKNHMDEMNRALNTPLNHLIISGGGAHSNVFMQIFADIFGVTTSRNQIKGSASVGCVINAGMAVGDTQMLLEVAIGHGGNAGAGCGAQIDGDAVRFPVLDCGDDTFT